MATRVVCGLLSPRCSAQARKQWNTIFREQEIDAFFDWYQTRSVADLELRLAEMFHHNRRGYTIDSSLQKAIIPLLDRVDPSAAEEGGVDTVVNEGGILIGYFFNDEHARFTCWFPSQHTRS